ncbi:hypothetical protein E4U60_000992 [Claviceps pazoutovae]|uniref:Uncharacterized protein n=1 Tax=Claviceps pazoutovae TaxID=1649127 RepID=A0A9P7SI89_9HYPO|nr:hypothetical protein E4U60_000992 [Claviceps pazoutovae]
MGSRIASQCEAAVNLTLRNSPRAVDLFQHSRPQNSLHVGLAGLIAACCAACCRRGSASQRVLLVLLAVARTPVPRQISCPAAAAAASTSFTSMDIPTCRRQALKA